MATPLAPLHVSSYSAVLLSGPVDQVPLIATGPLHPPDAVHAVASVALQDSFELPPLLTVVGVAISVTLGASEATAASADFAAAAPESVPAVWLVDADESSQAGSADNTAQTSVNRTSGEAVQPRECRRLPLDLNGLSPRASKEKEDFMLRQQAAILITRLPNYLDRRHSTRITDGVLPSALRPNN